MYPVPRSCQLRGPPSPGEEENEASKLRTKGGDALCQMRGAGGQPVTLLQLSPDTHTSPPGTCKYRNYDKNSYKEKKIAQ